MKKKGETEQTLAARVLEAWTQREKHLSNMVKHPKSYLDIDTNRPVDMAPYAAELEETQRLIRDLNVMKRFSYDASFVDLVERTFDIPTEDIIGQFNHASFPFDKVWLEGPGLIDLKAKLMYVRNGFMITTNAATQSLTFQHVFSEVTENYGPVLMTGLEIKISMDGISFDEDHALNEAMLAARIKDTKEGHDVGGAFIDLWFDTADFLARSLLVLGSDPLNSNFRRTEKTPADKDQEKLDRERIRMKRPPRLATTPIKIDVSRLSPRFFEKPSVGELRQLLGWTSVRQSKPIMRKDGTTYRRSPHDRRIPAPVDRRNVERELFASRSDVTLALKPGERPRQVLRDTAPGKMPNP